MIPILKLIVNWFTRNFRAVAVGLSDGNSENNNQSMLRNALQEDVQAGNLQLNFRYLIYYNKCNNVYQLVNAYPANITAPSA